MKKRKKTVLFVCTHNSARSPVAEGILRAEMGSLYETYSAGIYPFETDRRAVLAMKDAGYDISAKKPASLGQFSDQEFDYVVFLCRFAYKNAPLIPKAKNLIVHDIQMPSGSGGFDALIGDIRDWINDFF